MATSITNTDAVMLRASRRSTASAESGISMTNTMLTASAGTIQSPALPATEPPISFDLVAIFFHRPVGLLIAPALTLSLPVPVDELVLARGIRKPESQLRRHKALPESLGRLRPSGTALGPEADSPVSGFHANAPLL